MAFQLGIALGGGAQGLRSGWELGTQMRNAFNDAAAVEAGNQAIIDQKERTTASFSDMDSISRLTGIPVDRLRQEFPDIGSLSREDIQTRINRLHGEVNRPAAPAQAQPQGDAQPVLQGGIPLRPQVTQEPLPPPPGAQPMRPGAAPNYGVDGTDLSGKPPTSTAPAPSAPGDALEGGIPPVVGGGARAAAGLSGTYAAPGSADTRSMRGADARAQQAAGLSDPTAPGPQPLPAVPSTEPPPRIDPTSVDKTKATTTAQQVEQDQALAAAGSGQRAGAGLPERTRDGQRYTQPDTRDGRPAYKSDSTGVAPSTPGPQSRPGDATATRPASGQPRNFYDVQGIQEVGQNGQDTDRRNPRSSAMGPRQFVRETWLEYAKANPERFRGMTDEQILERRSSHEESLRASQWLARTNANTLRAANVPVNDATVGVSAFVGGGGAVAVLRAAPGTTVENALRQGGISERRVNAMVTAHPEFRTMTTDALMGDYERRYGTGTSYLGGPSQAAPERTTTTAQGQQTIAPPDAPQAVQNRWTVTMGRDGQLSLRDGVAEPRELDIIRMRAQAHELARRGDPRWAEMAERAQTMRTALRTEQSEEIQRGILRASVGGMDGLTRFLRDHHLVADGVTPQASTFQTSDGTTMHRLSYGGIQIEGHTPGEIGMRIAVMMGQNPQMVFQQLDHIVARDQRHREFIERLRTNRVQEGQTERELGIRERAAAATERRADQQDERFRRQEERQGLNDEVSRDLHREQTDTLRRSRERDARLAEQQREFQRRFEADPTDPDLRRLAERLYTEGAPTRAGERNMFGEERVTRDAEGNTRTTQHNRLLEQIERASPTTAANEAGARATVQQLGANPTQAQIDEARIQWRRTFRNGAAEFDRQVLPLIARNRRGLPPSQGRAGAPAATGLGAARPGQTTTGPNPFGR